MRQPLVKALTLTGVLVLGMFVGVVGGRLPVFASIDLFQNTTSIKVGPGDYCHLYELTLANDLHVSTSELEQANYDALQKTIDQLTIDGKVTAAEQATLEAALQKYGSDPCTNLPQALSVLAGDPALKQQLSAIHTALIADVAKSLKLTPATLESDLAHGKTLAQLAEEQNVSLDDVNAAYLHSLKTLLSQYVQQQFITQDQADWLYNLAVQAVNSGYYPLLKPIE